MRQQLRPLAPQFRLENFEKTKKPAILSLSPFFFLLPGFSTPKPPACMAGLGLENGNIPDSAITASTIANSYYRADQGRLQAQYESGGYGSWVASTHNSQQWFQVDFGSWTKVARVAIQGRLNAAQWVTEFKLAYSYDGVFYKDYNEDGHPKVLFALITLRAIHLCLLLIFRRM